jgi:nucleoside triphosphate diphosphatase
MTGAPADAATQLSRLAAIMARLRDPTSGCPWDVEQTFATIAPYTIEEAYEVADVIERGAMDELAGELGDLQLQVVFHARMAEEAGLFTLADVIADIADKMERRHPHVFGGAHHEDGAAAQAAWEALKASERQDRAETGTLDGVARALPALLRADKLQRRAARVGFDWPDATGPRAKIDEELAELAAARSDAERQEEFGDLLFAMVNWGRHLGLSAEDALRAASGKFERRFRHMEALAGAGFADLSLADKERLWAEAKAGERAPPGEHAA